MGQTIEQAIFGDIHPDAFKLFSGSSKHLHAELLEYLSEQVFDDAGVVNRPEVIDAMQEFLNANSIGSQEGDDPFGVKRANTLYARLVETGWLVEQRSSYKRLVDIDPGARILLDFLLDMKAGRLRNYGAEVIQVLSLLESADRDPENRSEALRSATRSARGFLNHLRTLSAGMGKAEEAISSHHDFSALFEAFFKDYVERHLIADYKQLHTKASPYRFRVRILELVDNISDDEFKLQSLAEAYIREGKAKSLQKARDAVSIDLRKIASVFTNIDGYLEIIEETRKRVEQRIRNTIKFLDSIEEANTETIERVLRKIGKHDFKATEANDCNLGTHLPSGPVHLFSPAKKSIKIEAQPIKRPSKSPAMQKYETAIQLYRERSVITPDKAEGYLDRILKGARSAEGKDLPINSLDDFFVFERLRGIEYLSGGALSDKWKVRDIEGVIDNGWIRCQNFIIERRTKESS
ncbi:Wadjet anti-phage system protein JetA family protein [Sulfitobacter sp. R18_1]|uniref:Wadjet anti-phage system protein JetA family protein n=1 Tax=Sulfitobacter sp. R18_1 TaxID=2821104 RepID=UPI001ADA05E7|nr:Wadjet anti-phage system protein JetA family protein [Sulfitobacter sp. R18_1]MBO9428669.1 hypothetical protein [Sulfitobacter sp. R18_1]